MPNPTNLRTLKPLASTLAPVKPEAQLTLEVLLLTADGDALRSLIEGALSAGHPGQELRFKWTYYMDMGITVSVRSGGTDYCSYGTGQFYTNEVHHCAVSFFKGEDFASVTIYTNSPRADRHTSFRTPANFAAALIG